MFISQSWHNGGVMPHFLLTMKKEKINEKVVRRIFRLDKDIIDLFVRYKEAELQQQVSFNKEMLDKIESALLLFRLMLLFLFLLLLSQCVKVG